MSTETSCAFPPAYTPSADPPSYSRQRSNEERTLTASGVRRNERLTSTFAKCSSKKDVILTLLGQPKDASLPIYGRNRRVEGSIALLDIRKRARVSKVSVKLEGHVKMTVADGGTVHDTIFNIDTELWSRGSSRNEPPPEIPFSIQMPQSCLARGTDEPLPPSYGIHLNGIPGLGAQVEYTVSVVVERRNNWLRKRKILSTPFIYLPRSRPPVPMLSSSNTFLDTVKVSPEVWTTHSSVMKRRNGVNELANANDFHSIDVHLAIPSERIYPIHHSIPFHVQLCAPSPSLRELLKLDPSPFVLRPSPTIMSNATSSTTSARSIFSSLSLCPPKPAQHPGCTFKITLMRQVMVHVHGQKAWRHVIIGEGKVTNFVFNDEECWAAWEGEIEECAEKGEKGEELKVGSFRVGDLKVADFIVLTISPATPARSPFLMHQQSVAVKLVSDPFDLSDEQYY